MNLFYLIFLIFHTIWVVPAQSDGFFIKFVLSGFNSKNSVQNRVEPAQPDFFQKIRLARLNRDPIFFPGAKIVPKLTQHATGFRLAPSPLSENAAFATNPS